MRRFWMLAVVAISLWCGGCKKELTVNDFPLQAGMTAEQIADKVGSPTKESAHWVGYTLKDTTELRLYFLGRMPDGTRTLSEAAIYNPVGTRMSTVFKLAPTAPATKPTHVPATNPVHPPTTTPVP